MLNSEIDEAMAAHSNALSGIWRLIRRVQRDDALVESEREEALRRLFSCLSFKDVRQTFVMDAIRLDMGVSFRSSMSGMMRLKSRMRRNGYNIAPGSNDKTRDLAFGSKLGLAVPTVMQENVAAESVHVSENVFIKPSEGSNSRGVFYVDDAKAVHSIRSKEVYSSFEEALSELDGKFLKQNWTVEEAIVGPGGGPARDMKVFMFYGVVGGFLEIDRSPNSSGKNRYAGYDATGARRDMSPNHQPMEGIGVPPDVVNAARTIALNTPTPFLRVDFLVGAERSYLGEITPHPGNTYAGDLFEDIDRELGEMFLDAEARLFIDLYNGKKFDLYEEVYQPGPVYP